MDTGDHRIIERVQDIEARVRLLEGWRVSLKQDLENVAAHSIEVDKKCSEMQTYLDERKAQRERQTKLFQDVKFWLVVIILGWVLTTFLDGAKIGIGKWLLRSDTGQHAR